MKVLFVGLGSIGMRHFRDFTSLMRMDGRSFQADALRSSNTPITGVTGKSLTRVFHSTDEVPSDYDVIFICNPTSLHYDTLDALKGKASYYFIEKPVFMDISRPISVLNLPDDAVYYVACPLRFSPVLDRIKEIVDANEVAAVRAICSSYLPDWRPGTDYRQCYSARKELGGGVRLDLIHELDYLTWIFGRPDSISSVYGKYSDLEMDVEDLSFYTAVYPDKLLSLQIDYIGKPTRRAVEIVLKSGETIIGDIANGAVRFLHSGVIERRRPAEDVRLTEMRYFIDLLDGKAENINDIYNAFNTLELALR